MKSNIEELHHILLQNGGKMDFQLMSLAKLHLARSTKYWCGDRIITGGWGKGVELDFVSPRRDMFGDNKHPFR